MEEKLYFPTSDALRLCGILSTSQNYTQKCIILCHGIGYHKDEDEDLFKNFAKRLSAEGFSVFRFDFRGHGESEGKSIDMTIAGEEKDIEAAVRFLKSKGFKNFGVLSQSFAGGAVSLFSFAHQDIVKTLVLWNSVIDYREENNPTLPWAIKYWGKPAFERVASLSFTEVGSNNFKVGKKLMREIKTLKPWKKLLKIKIPTLFVHGDNDMHVPYQDSVKYATAMKNAKLVNIHGAEHGFHENQRYAEQGERVTIEFFLKNM